MNLLEITDISKMYTLYTGHGARQSTFREAIYSSIRGMWVGRQLQEVEFWAIRNLSLQLKAGEILGLSGSNGSGKSTLLKLIAQVTYPTSGQIKKYGRVASLLEIGAGFHPELTGRENIYLCASIMGYRPQEVRSHFDEIVNFADISNYLEVPIKKFSSGMYVRLAVAIASHLPNEILLLDEVLAVADSAFMDLALKQLKKKKGQGAGIIIVSHDHNMLANVSDSIITLEKGSIKCINQAPN